MSEEKNEDKSEPRRKRTEFDDALKGYYQDHDEIRPDENMDYRSLTAGSVGSLILGFLSSLTIISGVFFIFPLIGIVLGVFATRKILKAPDVLSGLGTATAGIALSIVFAIVGLCSQYYLYIYSVPPGYVPIDFKMLAADPKTGRVPPEIVALAEAGKTQGVRVFIEGFMYQTRNMNDIESFYLVPALEQSKFAALTRSPTAMIEVNLTGDLLASYRTSPVRVGGILHVNQEYTNDNLPYRIEADLFR